MPTNCPKNSCPLIFHCMCSLCQPTCLLSLSDCLLINILSVFSEMQSQMPSASIGMLTEDENIIMTRIKEGTTKCMKWLPLTWSVNLLNEMRRKHFIGKSIIPYLYPCGLEDKLHFEVSCGCFLGNSSHLPSSKVYI